MLLLLLLRLRTQAIYHCLGRQSTTDVSPSLLTFCRCCCVRGVSCKTGPRLCMRRKSPQLYCRFEEAVRKAVTICPAPPRLLQVDLWPFDLKSVISRPTCFSSSLRCCLQVGSAPFVRRRCDCLASSAPFTNSQTYLLTYLKVVTKSRVTCPTSMSILVFLGLCVLDLGPIYATDRPTDRRQTRIIA